MYQTYWELQHAPFNNDGDPRFFVATDTHQSGLLKLRYLIENRKQVGVLVGATGTGKSYLLQALAGQLAETNRPLVRLAFPQMSSAELLAYLAIEMGGDAAQIGSSPGGVDRTVRELQRLLALAAAEERHPLILVDEAHLIDDLQVFQTLRLLLNFQQPQPSFTLILSGQRELLAQLRRIGEFEERLAVKCLLRPLNLEETLQYITHRLEVAGARRDIFEPTALTTIFEVTGGNPRRINRVCDLALLVGFAEESKSLSAEQVEAVASELTAAVPD